MADCAGRMEDRPRRIKVEVLPYDDIDVDTLLGGLSDGGLILRYEVEGQRFIEIPSFARHQRISGKEADGISRFPASTKKKTGKQRGSNGEAPGIAGNGRETEGKGNDGSFELFWTAYPKKKAKDKAKAAFAKVQIPIAVLIAAVRKAAESDGWRKDKGQFIPHAATWLNGKRWEDQEDELFTAPPRPIGPYDAPPEY